MGGQERWRRGGGASDAAGVDGGGSGQGEVRGGGGHGHDGDRSRKGRRRLLWEWRGLVGAPRLRPRSSGDGQWTAATCQEEDEDVKQKIECPGRLRHSSVL